MTIDHEYQISIPGISKLRKLQGALKLVPPASTFRCYTFGELCSIFLHPEAVEGGEEGPMDGQPKGARLGQEWQMSLPLLDTYV